MPHKRQARRERQIATLQHENDQAVLMLCKRDGLIDRLLAHLIAEGVECIAKDGWSDGRTLAATKPCGTCPACLRAKLVREATATGFT